MESGRSNVGLKALSGPECVFEFMLNALRLTDGFDETLFTERTGLQGSLLRDRLAELREKQLIDEVQSGIWRVTGLGQRFLNDLQAEFLP